MANELTSLERETLLRELRRVFEETKAEALVKALEVVVAHTRDGWVTREDFAGLREIVTEMAAAQRDLAAAQARTEERRGRLEEAVQRLAEAQVRSEERAGRLEVVVEQLATAVRELTEGVDRLRKQVGGLSETVGGDIEDIAYIVLHDVLKREFGWQVSVLGRSWEKWDEEPEEVNVFGRATDPKRPEQTIWIVGEAKYNLTLNEVDRFARQVERARRHLMGEVFPVCFCYRARPEVQERIQQLGLRLVFSYGKLV